MRVTIISNESRVGVDGEFRIVDLTGLKLTIHAVQWDSVLGEGHIEYRGPNPPRNRKITDFSPYQVFVGRWNAVPSPPPDPPPPLFDAKQAEKEIANSPVTTGLIRELAQRFGVTESDLITAIKGRL